LIIRHVISLRSPISSPLLIQHCHIEASPSFLPPSIDTQATLFAILYDDCLYYTLYDALRFDFFFSSILSDYYFTPFTYVMRGCLIKIIEMTAILLAFAAFHHFFHSAYRRLMIISFFLHVAAV